MPGKKVKTMPKGQKGMTMAKATKFPSVNGKNVNAKKLKK